MGLPQTCIDDIFQCVSYLMVMPFIMFSGLIGSIATFFILNGSKFRNNTFFYLKALSLSDLMYLVLTFGYIYEIMFLESYASMTSVAKAYLTTFDAMICNTFIATSGFIIILVTIDRWRCICSPSSPGDSRPGLNCFIALLSSLGWQIPSNIIDYGDICDCDQTPDSDSECREFLSVVDREDMMGQYPWVIYVILAEMFTRIIPSFLLVILNTKMIKRFHEVIEKRGIMRAKNFMEGSSKLNLTFTEKTRIKDDDDDDHVSYELGVGVTVIRSRGTSREKVAMSEDDRGGERRPSEQGRLVSEDSKPKYYDISKKDRSLIRLLFMMSIVFFATNIPMAVARIMQAFGHTENKVFKDFVVVANVMEILFAASNFYLYCFCNHQFRRNIKPVIGSNNRTMSRTILLILAAYFLRPSFGCKTNLQYVAPAGDLNCLPCEKDAVSWPLGVKIFWFIMRVWSMGYLKYDCCKVEVEKIERAQILRSRYLQSDPNCGLKGRPRRWRKKHAENQTEEDLIENKEKEERIVKDGSNRSRVIGGTLTARGEIPWQVAILKEDYTTWDGCGGVLLSCDPVIIVTAAHCVHKRQPEQVKLGLSVRDLNDRHERLEWQLLNVSNIVVHPEFKQVNVHYRNLPDDDIDRIPKFFFNGINLTVWENDIAILKIADQGDPLCVQEETFGFITKHIRPACLPKKNANYVGLKGLVSGWGKTHAGLTSRQQGNPGGYIGNPLRKVKIPVVSDAECVQNVFQSSFGIHNLYTLSPKQICAGDIAKIKGPCEVFFATAFVHLIDNLTKGDSGSPLVVDVGDLCEDKVCRQRWTAVGLVSWRNAGGSPGAGGGCLGATYTVFTEIAEYTDWIAIESGLLPPID